MTDKNVFVVGPEATGPAFIGRRQEVRQLRGRVLEARQSTGYAVVGPYRIGKSSLVSYALREDEIRGQGQLYMKMVMKDYISAYHFWTALLAGIGRELEEYSRVRPEGADMTGLAQRLQHAAEQPQDENWYIRLHGELTIGMRKLKEHRIPLVLIIDEFDHAARVFEGNASYFSLLRTFGTGADYLVNTVLIARHELHTIEEKDPATSNLAGAYEQLILRDMNESDMEDYYGVLADCNVFLDEEARERLYHYAGTYPYLLSMFGRQMAEMGLMGKRVDSAALDRIFEDRLPMVDSHYKHLVESLRQDRDLEKIIGVTIGPSMDMTVRDIKHLEALGYLKETGEGYVAFSPDFCEYLRGVQADFPAWELLMETERTLKGFFGRAYPMLKEFRYVRGQEDGTLWDRVKDTYPELKLNGDMMKKSMKSMLRWTDEATVLDVLSLDAVIKRIKAEWEKYRDMFGGKDLAFWEEKLDLINEARKPMAHARADVVRPHLPTLRVYCEQVLELKQK